MRIKRFLIPAFVITILTLSSGIGSINSVNADENSPAAPQTTQSVAEVTTEAIQTTTENPEVSTETKPSESETAETQSSEKTSKKTQKKKSKKKKDSVTKITISAAGDCTLGIDSHYNGNFNSYYDANGPEYFLKKVKPVFAKDDITVVNFEGTLTESGNRQNKTYTFKGPAKHVNILKKGSVEVVNLANNHSFDFGPQGLSDTQATLRKNKILFCYKSCIAYKKVKGVKIAFIGLNKLDGDNTALIDSTISAAKKAKAQIIIVNYHWGEERVYQADGLQKFLGKYCIDRGADLVIGHHPHVLQGIENYKGKYIVYSLGNFCFGGNVNPSDKDTMIFQQTFYIKKGKLQKTRDARIIPCSLSGVSYTNNYQPVILKKSAKAHIINKVRGYSSGMNISIKSDGTLK